MRRLECWLGWVHKEPCIRWRQGFTGFRTWGCNCEPTLSLLDTLPCLLFSFPPLSSHIHCRSANSAFHPFELLWVVSCNRMFASSHGRRRLVNAYGVIRVKAWCGLLIGAVVCLLAASRGSNCTLTRACNWMAAVCQSTATFEIVKLAAPPVRPSRKHRYIRFRSLPFVLPTLRLHFFIGRPFQSIAIL